MSLQRCQFWQIKFDNTLMNASKNISTSRSDLLISLTKKFRYVLLCLKWKCFFCLTVLRSGTNSNKVEYFNSTSNHGHNLWWWHLLSYFNWCPIVIRSQINPNLTSIYDLSHYLANENATMFLDPILMTGLITLWFSRMATSSITYACQMRCDLWDFSDLLTGQLPLWPGRHSLTHMGLGSNHWITYQFFLQFTIFIIN